jgi:uncharacterized protein (DUF433 family)
MNPELLLEHFERTGFGATLRKGGNPMKDQGVVIHRDPDILGGTPVFVGTRVPVKALLDYLAGGHTLDDFLDDFPTVTRVQAVAAKKKSLGRDGSPSRPNQDSALGESAPPKTSEEQ